MPSWKKVIISGSDAELNSLNVSNGITGSLHGTASWAENAITASYSNFALTASYVNPLSQTVAVSGSIRFDPTPDPDLAGSDLDSTYLFQSASNTTLGYDLYFRQNGNITKWKWAEGQLASGLLYGGIVSWSGSNVYVSSGSGIIVNYNATTGSEISPIIDYVTWNSITSSITNITSSQVTYLYIDDNGALQQQSQLFTSEQFQQYIPLGAVGHFNYANIQAFGGDVNTAYGQQTQTNAFIDAFGPMKLNGYTLTPQTNTLHLNIGSGTSFIHGGFYKEDPNDPSTYTSNSQITASIVRCYTSGSETVFLDNTGSFFTTVDPTKWDNNGVLDTVNASNWSIQRVFSYPQTNTLYIYYGQSEYTTFTNALQYLASDPFVEGLATQPFTVFVGYLITKGNTTNLADTNNNRIIQAGLYRSTVGGSLGGAAVATNLEDLADVTITTPVTGEALIYNAGIWQNGYPTSASYAVTASFAQNASTASYIEIAQTASYVLNAVSASYTANALSSSHAITASYALDSDLLDGKDSTTFATTGSNVFKGLQTINGNIFMSGSNPLIYNNSAIDAMLFGFFDGSNIYGPYYQIFGNNYSNVTQRGSAEFVFDTRNGGESGFNVVSFDGSTWTRKFRVNDSGAEVTGSFIVTGGITGSLFGTASWAENAITASYVETAQTASYVLNAVSASFATTASFAQTASFVQTAQTASYVQTAQTASFVQTAQTASYVQTAQTSSYVEYANVANKPTLVSGSSQITYSGISGIPSGIISSSAQLNNSTLTGMSITGSFTGSFTGDGSGLTGIPIPPGVYQYTGSNNTAIVPLSGSNVSSACFATVGGGRNNTANGTCSTVGGGCGNIASGNSSFVGGGINNRACGPNSIVVGGGSSFFFNSATQDYAVVVGGEAQNASGGYSFIGGGSFNTTSGCQSTIAGGGSNIADGTCSTIGGGTSNAASCPNSTVSGGYSNTASGGSTNIGGTTVSGGRSNTASGNYSTVSGGRSNTANGACSGILGGTTNHTCGCSEAFIIGSNICATAACYTFMNNTCTLGTTRTTTLVETSARKHKEQIFPLGNQLSKINKLNPVEFVWKSNGIKDMGLIAEEVEQIYPELVSREDNGEIHGIHYSKITAVLVKALQEQQAEIEVLKNEIQKLKETI